MLRAYPPKFRHKYSREMAVVFHDRARDVVQSMGTLALFPFMLQVARDWATTVTRERLDMDITQKVKLNRVSTHGLIALSLTALMMVLPFVLVNLITGHVPPPATDEGRVAYTSFNYQSSRCSRWDCSSCHVGLGAAFAKHAAIGITSRDGCSGVQPRFLRRTNLLPVTRLTHLPRPGLPLPSPAPHSRSTAG